MIKVIDQISVYVGGLADLLIFISFNCIYLSNKSVGLVSTSLLKVYIYFYLSIISGSHDLLLYINPVNPHLLRLWSAIPIETLRATALAVGQLAYWLYLAQYFKRGGKQI